MFSGDLGTSVGRCLLVEQGYESIHDLSFPLSVTRALLWYRFTIISPAEINGFASSMSVSMTLSISIFHYLSIFLSMFLSFYLSISMHTYSFYLD